MFLLDEIGIQYVTNTASIEQNSKNQRISEAVLIGRPKYSLSDISTVEKMASRSFSRNFQNASISDLPGTEVEVKAIREQLETFSIQVRQYLGASAKEEVLHNLESPEILHIATHGFWSKSENATATYRLFNAMTNSGLLLAGVADYYSSKEFKDAYDGILTAYEAQGLDMEGTQLVILSACETGLGDFDAGEGVYGLQRAFRAAGARSIMTSLWKVDDEGTKDFMISLYRHLLASGDKWIAYNTAQQEIKSKYTDPFYWGAFVLIGE